MTDIPDGWECTRDRLPLRGVVRAPGYLGWWWHVEDAQGRLVSFIGHVVTDIKEPDGVAARGRARTQRGAKARCREALRHAESHFPPEGGWTPNRFATDDGKTWQLGAAG